jgi:hypothetical protein
VSSWRVNSENDLVPPGKLTPPLTIMANASPSATEPAPAERTWHRSDHARFSAAIRRSRHPMGGPYSPQAAGHQAKLDELAEAIAAIFTARRCRAPPPSAPVR